MHLESAVMGVEEAKQRRVRAPRLGSVGRRQTLNVFAADGRDVSAEVGSEEAMVDERAFVKQPSVIFTRGKKGCHYTLLLLDFHKEDGHPPLHRLHWLVTDIPGEEFGRGCLSGGKVLAEYEPPRAPTHAEPRLYVLMVFEQRGGSLLAKHPDLAEYALQRSSFPLTSWLSRNGPKMARIAACQQFRAHISPAQPLCVGETIDRQEGELADAEDSDSSDDRRESEDKENQPQKQKKSYKSKIFLLRRLLSSKRRQRSPIGPH